MSARCCAAMIGALVLAACGAGDRQQEEASVSAGADGVAGDASDVGRLDAAGEDRDPDAVLEEVQRGSPEDVVRLLLQWDTAGFRFQGAYADALAQLYCYQPDQQCLSDEPGWDFVLAVDGFTLEPVLEAADSAQYVITFDEVGAIWPDAMQEPGGSPPETLSLKRMNGKWRVVGVESQMPPHLSRAAVLRTYRGIHPDSQVIAGWLQERE